MILSFPYVQKHHYRGQISHGPYFSYFIDIKADSLAVGSLLQEEFITSIGMSVFKVSFFVRSGVNLVDSRMDVGITPSNVRDALDTVTVTSTSSTHDEFIFSGDVAAIFNLRYLVGLPVKQTIASDTYNLFQTVLENAWSTKYSSGELV